MFTSLEGMAKDNAKMINENGDLHVTRILDRLDSLYGVSMTFQSLNSTLCGLQQKLMYNTRLPIHHRPWPDSEYNDDGAPIERHDTGALPR